MYDRTNRSKKKKNEGKKKKNEARVRIVETFKRNERIHWREKYEKMVSNKNQNRLQITQLWDYYSFINECYTVMSAIFHSRPSFVSRFLFDQIHCFLVESWMLNSLLMPVLSIAPYISDVPFSYRSTLKSISPGFSTFHRKYRKNWYKKKNKSMYTYWEREREKEREKRKWKHIWVLLYFLFVPPSSFFCFSPFYLSISISLSISIYLPN